MSSWEDRGSTGLNPLEFDEFDRYERRRLKAAIALAIVWSCTIALHIIAWGQWIVYGLTLLTGARLLRLMLAFPERLPEALPSYRLMQPPAPLNDASEWPRVSILVAAKNEVSVVERLATSLMRIDYPSQQYDVWLIDDNSTDGTGELMDHLARQYPNLYVVHRDQTAFGGKSGALNQVWPKTVGSLLLVFDADAQVTPDCLRRAVPMFDQAAIGAVQLRKVIANADRNFWTRSQVAEMAFDAYCQLKRVSRSGIGELRGNGQFVRRTALEQCGGWNEETITDDLDLTLKLHLTGWDVSFMMVPAVFEEGVVRAVSLWHQRNRWAEGGYQRYLDYWRLLTPTRLGLGKAFDLVVFWILQYALPTAALPDFALAIARNRLPVFAPLSSAMFLFATLGMAQGLRRTQSASLLSILIQTMRGMVYMTHWFLIIGTVTLRMAFRPKRLKWVKTQHAGADETSLLKASVSSQ
jgi:1,2-diacylglycerol 3-beta-glucosyltransferase